MARVDTFGQLTSDEVLVIQAIKAGTYFVDGGTPTGTIDSANVTFTLASAPTPATSLEVFKNGGKLTLTEDYTLVGSTLTLVVAPDPGDIIRVNYRFSPA